MAPIFSFATERSIKFQPIIILGAGRSGTNALRDMISRLPDTTTWPCDEINPIWRFGNSAWKTDRIPAYRASPRVKRFIRKAFAVQSARGNDAKYVVEKTCANTLRVSFINAVLPEAKFIVIVRDGRAVVPSAVKRWQGELEVPNFEYFLAKARFVPLTSLPYVGWRFVRSRIGKLLGKPRLSFWGPRFDDEANLGNYTLEQVCALQWRACVDATYEASKELPTDRVLRIRYEDLMADPNRVLLEIIDFMSAVVSSRQREHATAIIREFRKDMPIGTMTEGGWDRRFDAKTLEILAPCLREMGYN